MRCSIPHEAAVARIDEMHRHRIVAYVCSRLGLFGPLPQSMWRNAHVGQSRRTAMRRDLE
jgi:hypothetical protein